LTEFVNIYTKFPLFSGNNNSFVSITLLMIHPYLFIVKIIFEYFSFELFMNCIEISSTDGRDATYISAYSPKPFIPFS
jgi:hypothetical protein